MLRGAIQFGLGAVCMWVSCVQGLAQFPNAAASFRSFSGQFVVRGVEPGVVQSDSTVGTNRDFVRLDASSLPVSCERVKQAVYRELGATGNWQGKIYVGLYPARSAEDGIGITADQFRDGWVYRVELPEIVARDQYVRAMVQVVLQEYANRTATTHGAELPTWFVEGLAEIVLASTDTEVVLEAPRAVPITGLALGSIDRERKQNPKEQPQKQLERVLSFEQLSWPTAGQLAGEPGKTYRGTARLFVSELLALNNGRACARAFLGSLPQYYNWQFAFLNGFRPHFQRPLDVEKWWALETEHFTRHELAETWPREESWRKLDEVVHSAVQVRLETNDLPFRADVTLQTIIREWEPGRQREALQRKLRELDALRLRMASEYLPLLDEYRKALLLYLQPPEAQGQVGKNKKTSPQQLAVEVVQQLDALDAWREDARPRQVVKAEPKQAPVEGGGLPEKSP